MYEIQSKSDFQTGATLIVRMPEEELDQKALYTIMADKPDFVLPFRHRFIDGQIEFTYQIGKRSKLAHLSGSRSPGEYADLWFGVLQPLLDCGDWFMTPYSFVLKPEYLYCDKNGRVISYVYIPSTRDCSDYDALKAMVTEIARQNHVTDMNLENKIVWALQDFQPNEFLQMVKPFGLQNVQEGVQEKGEERELQPVQSSKPPARQPVPAQPEPKPPLSTQVSGHRPDESIEPVGSQKKSDDIAIQFPAGGKAPKEGKPKTGLFGPKKEKQIKPKPEPKEKGGFWGKKKKQQEIIQGAAAEPLRPEFASGNPIDPVYIPPTELDDDVTQLDMIESDGPKFRYVGHGEHPKVIDVDIAEGGVFTIGRFDVSVGERQSSFEFDKKTRAVSRRHAAIERNADGYSIADLDSAAGTFLNGRKLPPNASFQLERGCRVSFGHSGADYFWEE